MKHFFGIFQKEKKTKMSWRCGDRGNWEKDNKMEDYAYRGKAYWEKYCLLGGRLGLMGRKWG